MNEMFFHWMFVFVFITFMGIRAVYQRKAQQTRGKIEYRENRLMLLFRLGIGIPFMLLVLAYMIRPGILAWATVALPDLLQWLGVLLGLASLPLIWWVQEALGSNFSTTLHVRSEHTLVTQGPYRWVRHPMYTVLYMVLLAVFLLTGNWLISGVFLVSMTMIVLFRLGNEEAVMLEKFGEDYRRYMQRTGRFLPRLTSKFG